jgi:SAM-dependent methyltransferase
LLIFGHADHVKNDRRGCAAGFANFDELYGGGDEQWRDGPLAVTPWDIGEPQPVVQQLVACGAVRGEVLDPGTGPGYNAIYYASKGYSVTGIDAAAAGIERAKRNAEQAGVSVDFQVADATKLDGLKNRFDTVIDSLFYHVFLDDEETQTRYAQALHRATRPGARLFMLEMGRHNVNGLQFDGLSADNFKRVLPTAGWRIDYLGTTTYQNRLSAETITEMLHAGGGRDLAERMKPIQEQLVVIEPLLVDHLVHLSAWVVAATRID